MTDVGDLYDRIGATYSATRCTDPRIAAHIWAALGDAQTVLNVGAGTGSYEPSDRSVVAVEPSAVMRSKRLLGSAPCVPGSAEELPFEDQSFDAAMAVCTLHHWNDPIAGLGEMRRVASRVVVFLFDTSDTTQFWLTRDYIPEFARLRSCQILAIVADLAESIGGTTQIVPIPWDCSDGFFEAFWRRPDAYLHDQVRRGTSVWDSLGPQVERRVITDLGRDLDSGLWATRNQDLIALDDADLGARLLVA